MRMLKTELITVLEGRARKEFDLDDLMESIKRLGIIEPIVLNKDYVLLAGERRLRVARQLKMKTVPVVISGAPELEVQQAENECRKAFTISERVNMARAIARDLEEKKAREEAEKTAPEANGEEEPQPESKKRIREEAASGAGFGSDRTMRRAEEVVKNGCPELVQAMDQKKVKIHKAAELAELPHEEQKARLAEMAKPRRKDETTTLVDALGQEVPPGLRDVFADQSLHKLIGQMEQAELILGSARQFNSVTAKSKSLPYLKLAELDDRASKARFYVNAVLEELRDAIPYCVCQSCQGSGKSGEEGCIHCRSSGWQPQWRRDEWERQQNFGANATEDEDE